LLTASIREFFLPSALLFLLTDLRALFFTKSVFLSPDLVLVILSMKVWRFA
jgi:hypothetical protein